MRKNVFVFIVLMTNYAFSQVRSGTIVVINVTEDQIVVAADSLAINQGTGVPDYSHCKIAALDHQLIFTSVGNTIFVNNLSGEVIWDNIIVARDSVRDSASAGVIDIDTAIAKWAQAAKGHWDSISQSQARDIAEKNKSQFTAAALIGKGLTGKIAVIDYDTNVFSIDRVRERTGNLSNVDGCLPCGQLKGGKICGMGAHPDVMTEFCSKRKHGDRISVRTPLKGASQSTKLAVKIVEMTIDTYGKTAKDVGGKVDAVTITKGGAITWNSRKENCPENQD
jgi:hypothetical protein